MSDRVEDYDDDAELTEYIWQNYPHLFTSLESITNQAILADQKARSYGGRMAKTLREMGKPKRSACGGGP